MRVKLTDRFAATAPLGIHWDTEAKGLLLQVTTGGSRAYRFNFRRQSDGVERRLTVGDTSAWPIAEARKRVSELRRMVDTGRDPLGDLEARRAAPTVADLVKRFEEEALPSRAPGTQREYLAQIRDYILPALGKLKVDAVEREHIERLHRRISAENKPRRANTVRALCSVIFGQAVAWKLRTTNPASGIKGNPDIGRERFLTAEEIERVTAVLDRLWDRRTDSVDAIRLLLLTGARRGEVLAMRWADIDLTTGVWVKPAATTKQRKIHRTPLNAEAIELLRRRLVVCDAPSKVVRLNKREGDVFVFRGGGSVSHIGMIERDWSVIRAAAGIEDVRLHDLRHSYASLLVSQGLSLPVIGALLGHAAARTTQRYAHLADQPLREAAAIVGQIVGGGPKTR